MPSSATLSPFLPRCRVQAAPLGTGAFSTVVRAVDGHTGGEVAIKLIERGNLVSRWRWM